MSIPSFVKNQAKGMYDGILTIVIRFMGVFTTALLRSCGGVFDRIQAEVTEQIKEKKCGSKPPMNPSPIKLIVHSQ